MLILLRLWFLVLSQHSKRGVLLVPVVESCPARDHSAKASRSRSRPQLLLWIDPDAPLDDAPGAEPSAEPDDQEEQEVDEDDLDDLDDVGNISFQSLRTVPASRRRKEQITDLAIVHLIMGNTLALQRLLAVERTVLLELKRYISRGKECDSSAVTRHLREAKVQFIKQAAHVFAQTDAQEVRAIAAAGPWWTSTILKRHPAAPKTRLSGDKLAEYMTTGQLDVDTLVQKAALNGNHSWRKPVRLGEPSSNQRLETITRYLDSLPQPEPIVNEVCILM
ncbi:hypothetical protein BDZ89DRAFT_1135562 [Hymenopellis radicata]|nr:hypothetical protein BDZ89DRAFT_1135562 [Hymenopellis radicata]